MKSPGSAVDFIPLSRLGGRGGDNFLFCTEFKKGRFLDEIMPGVNVEVNYERRKYQ